MHPDTDSTLPALGEHGVYFLESLDKRTVHPLRGWGQGHFILSKDPVSRTTLVRNSANKIVTGLSIEPEDPHKNMNARSAAGVSTKSALATPETDRAITLEEFKRFITEMQP